MPKGKPKAKEKPAEKEKAKLSPQEQAKALFDNNKADHLNYVPETLLGIPSGSIKIDSELGVLKSGCHRFLGPSTSGKTSATLNYMLHFLNGDEKRFAVYFNAEGRLYPELRDISGLQFTWNAEEWTNKNVFVVDSQVIEFNFQFTRDLLLNNPNGNQYFFCFDSADAMGRRDDLAKDFEESAKVAGGPVVTSDFFRKAGLALNKRGSVAIFIGQERSKMQINPYQSVGQSQGKSSGGNAIIHAANLAIEFLKRREDDYILDKSGKKIGHNCRIRAHKTTNEKYGVDITFPIKYGKVGCSIWQEREIVEMLLMWGLIKKKGAWFSFEDSFRSELEKAGCNDFGDAIQGLENLYSFFEEERDTLDFAREYILNIIG